LLIGEYEHSLDAKGRLIMPSKLRDDIGEKFIITKGLDGCLFAFSIEEWKIFEQKLRSLPISNKDARAFSRFFFAGAMDCEIDKQGRFLISSNLREFAELSVNPIDSEKFIEELSTVYGSVVYNEGDENVWSI
jgi:MraZ protein